MPIEARLTLNPDDYTATIIRVVPARNTFSWSAGGSKRKKMRLN